MPVKSNSPMPACNLRDQEYIIDAIQTFRGAGREACEELLDEIGAVALCKVLHSMRRWYVGQTWAAAKHILTHRNALKVAMDLDAPLGAYRGFKVPKKSELADLEVGDEITIPVERNGGCSSWTLSRKRANCFSGATKDKVGLVVKLIDDTGVRAFIAPPEDSEPWFNRFYEKTMGTSFRKKEREYAICADEITVEVVAVKRR